MTAVEKVSANLEKLRSKIAYDGETDRKTLILQAKILLRASGEMVLEAGKRLCVLKETLEHGEFLRALKEIGIEYRTAHNLMTATIKISHNSNVKSIALLGPTKIYDLALLDDDYLAELDENGTIAGVTLDEYDRMTTRELRIKIRELNARAKQQQESFDRLMKAEQETKQRLADDLHKLESAEPRHRWSAEAKQVNLDILTLSGELIQQMGRAFDLADRVRTLKESDFSTAQFTAIKNLQSLRDQFDEYVSNFGMKVDQVFPESKPGLEGYDPLAGGLDQ